jgi:hypothetical protein
MLPPKELQKEIRSRHEVERRGIEIKYSKPPSDFSVFQRLFRYSQIILSIFVIGKACLLEFNFQDAIYILRMAFNKQKGSIIGSNGGIYHILIRTRIIIRVLRTYFRSGEIRVSPDIFALREFTWSI